MHTWYSEQNQPYSLAGYTIFVAEVASTVNEILMTKYLLEHSDAELKKYVLNHYLDQFRTTVLRQTMFAEFEKISHAMCEAGEPLTHENLSQNYAGLNRLYYGDTIKTDDTIALEWARIPHFYNAFYVYKYATGYSAATAISSKILNEGAAARDAYIEFLKTGESDYPIELLKIAGVDMGRPEPIIQAMDAFEKLIVEIEKLV
jgi:oligoendopeptidase F